MEKKFLHTFLRSALTLILLSIFTQSLPTKTLAAPNNPQTNPELSFTQITLTPNIETIGVAVSGIDLPNMASLQYRQSNEATWHTGHPLMRIADGRLVGSLFDLSPATTYEIKVLHETAEISAATTTQPEELAFLPATILHVDQNALVGGNGSAAAPFQHIQDAINQASPGTQILVADGVYKEELNFPNSGAPGNWIQVRAAGTGAILDGAKTVSGDVWNAENKANVYSKRADDLFRYLARDGERFYNYSGLGDLRNDTRGEGWYLDEDNMKLYIRSKSDPATHEWQVPFLNNAFTIESQNWIWIEGFEMRFYGTGQSGYGIYTNNVSHLVIRKNKIHHMRSGIFINWSGGDDQGNDTRIEYNEIYDNPVNEWAWEDVKSTTMEGTAIILRGHIGAIVRGNDIHNFFNGIYTGSSAARNNPELAFDIDVYDNYIHQISDDALEPEGACVNHRFRNNTIETAFVGVSLAPVTMGPTWVLRSTFANYTGRGVKWDRNSNGIALIYHNTFWTTAQDIAAMDFISSADNGYVYNNIFQNTSYGVYEVQTGSHGQNWDHNNWHSPHSPLFKWEDKNIYNIDALCTVTGFGCNSHDANPALTNPGYGDFSLQASSPNIDRGVVIHGINDGFHGTAPDIGALESVFGVTLPPTVVSILRTDATPTNADSVNFTINFSEDVTGLSLSPPFDDLALTTSSGTSDASITSVVPISGRSYTVNVRTGAGSGDIRLDLVDDNSIMNAAGIPLGGDDLGDGNFNTGETYSIERTTPTIPTITAIMRISPSPTSAETVSFSLSFSEPVTGLDASDFALNTSGSLSDVAVSEISGDGQNYIVTVLTGCGNGALRLDLLDDDSIINQAGNPLGGTGLGNGNFNMGEPYMIDKITPCVTAILRKAIDPTSAENVTFDVGFTEAVSGVDASDFALTTTGEITGASIISVSGAENMYTVTISTGDGNGSLRLDLLDNDSIVDAVGNPLGGVGAGNGNFLNGETYTVNKPIAEKQTISLTSNGKNDGWVLESSENSEEGDKTNDKAVNLVVGDNNQNAQYRSILHFPTKQLPNNIVVTDVMIMIKKYDSTGDDLFSTHGKLLVDIQYGAFGNWGPFPIKGLQSMDFQSPACQNAAAEIHDNPMGDWYWAILDPAAIHCINLTGNTQFRLRFELDDDNDMAYDYVRFYSGDSPNLSDRPYIIVVYHEK